MVRSLGAAVALFQYLKDEDQRLRTTFPYL